MKYQKGSICRPSTDSYTERDYFFNRRVKRKW